MNENELVEKIKILKSIKPDQNWVLNTKTQILGQSHRESLSMAGITDWLRGRAFLVLPSVIALLLMGIFAYNNLISLEKTSQDAEALEAVASNLGLVYSNLLATAVNLEKVQQADKIVKVKDSVDSALKNGQKLVVAARETAAESKKVSPDVLAAIVDVENALDRVETVYSEKEKQVAENLIQDLENRSLTEEQQALLEQAKEYYVQGMFNEALIKLLEI